MLTPASRHVRRTSWAATALETGVLLFAGGLTLLYLNPFWHFDEAGFLDSRLHWWDIGGQALMAVGLLTAALALLALIAAGVSRVAGRQSWPYTLAGIVVLCLAVWALSSGLLRDMTAHFEWNSADGFTLFQVRSFDGTSGTWQPIENSAFQWFVEIQLQPLLRGYFKMNDWQKMNGDVAVRVARLIPVAWPVGLGSGGETLEDPDQTPLMRAAVQGDLKTLKQLLAGGTGASVNSLDQGGQSALILACQNPKTKAEVVSALLSAGANVNLRSRNGYTALTWALARNNIEVTRLLRRAGGRP